MRHRSLAALLLLLGATPALAHQPPAPAAWIFRHGVVHTQDPDRPRATAVAVAHGRILAVGDDAAVMRHRSALTRVVELAGKAVVPGFHDGHVHPATSGVELGDCNLNGLDVKGGARAAIQRAVQAYARANPRKAWIRGGGWELTWFPGGKPHKAWLDAVVPDRPVAIWSTDAHTLWANSRALAIAGVSRATKDPAHGRIDRDARGEPTGTLREDAMDLVGDRMPAVTAAEYDVGLARGLAELRAKGITTAIEANADPAVLAAYARAARAGRLTAKVVVSQTVDLKRGAEQVPGLIARARRHASARVRPHAAKLFLDGVVEAQTARLVAPYVGGKHPPLGLPQDRLDAIVTALDAAGWQAHMHATGDGGVRAGLDAAEAARRANGPRGNRHAIAHAQMIDPADVPRFRDLGVVACFQPFWAMRDAFIRDLTEPFIGPVRSARLYPIGEVVRSGAPVAFGSDWSVSSLDPLDGIAVAAGRRDPAEGPGPAWLPDQRITAAQALAGYTRGAAWMARHEDRAGMLKAGFDADLVVLAADPLRLPPHRIPKDARVLLTMLDGEPVYRAKGF